MALSQVEKALCWQAAIGQDLRGHGWGSPTMGYCPIGAVVAHRGGQLYMTPEGDYTPYCLDFHPPLCDGSRRITPEESVAYLASLTLVRAAEADVLAWSGYATFEAMTTALMAQGAAAFPQE